MSNKNPRREGMNARAPLTSLTRSHAQRGWGGFDRCMTYAMQGLAVCLPSKSAEGRTTAYQVAIASHITDRWAREGLKRLEAAGLISWERGGIGPDGCPRPSWIRVDKRAYLAWINLREWVKRKKDNAVARYRAYRERVSKIEHRPPAARRAGPGARRRAGAAVRAGLHAREGLRDKRRPPSPRLRRRSNLSDACPARPRLGRLGARQGFRGARQGFRGQSRLRLPGRRGGGCRPRPRRALAQALRPVTT